MIETAFPPAFAVPKIRRFSVEEYVQREIETNQKHYFINGKLIPMAGASTPHNHISTSLIGEFYHQISDKLDFNLFGSDQKIYLPKLNIYNYADVLVVFGEPIFSQKEAQAIENPILIVEILSKSTGGYDKKTKFEEYKTAASFREYVLVNQDKPEITTHFREPDGTWRPAKFAGLASEVWFETLALRLPLSKIYRKVSFETP